MRTSRSPVILAGVLALLLVAVLAPAAARACSCVPPDMIIDSLGEQDDQVAFSGRVGPAIGNRVPVEVSGWFGGPAPAAVVSLEVSPGDGASCGTTPPPAGRQFLFVSYDTGTGAYGLSLCSVAADLATPEGQATLQAVTDKLGPPFAVAQPPPEPTSPPAEPDPTVASASADLTTVALPGIGALLVGVLVLVGLVLLLGRRREV